MEAQTPTLNPEQTVNVATGQMAFSLPLGVVKGVNRHDATISLSYAAGIKQNHVASPAGLGFGVEAGSISRKVVYVPDDCLSYTGGFPRSTGGGCIDRSGMDARRFITEMVLTFASALISLIPGAGPILAATFEIVSFSAEQISMQRAQRNKPSDYISGGQHLLPYNENEGHGTGFLVSGTQRKWDLPDVYFISTPYISGEFTWTGSRESGKFVMRNEQTVEPTVKIDYDWFSRSFTFTLADGTVLEFYERDYSSQYSQILGSEYLMGKDCVFDREYELQDFVTQWHLTCVKFPDYSGPANPLDGGGSGSWLEYTYNQLHAAYNYENVSDGQIAPNMIGTVRQPKFKINSLIAVNTPNETAQLHYECDRSDAALFPRLTSIEFFPRNATIAKRRVHFNSDYLLRPNTLSSTASPRKGSLTLRSILIDDCRGKQSLPVFFDYDLTHNEALNDNGPAYSCPRGAHDNVMRPKYRMEDKDIWGFYKPAVTANNFNEFGSPSLALRPDNTAYADAWSLKSISLPDGRRMSWEYESNKFDMANNIPIPFGPCYGGGVRVREVSASGTQGKDLRLTYFYTNEDGEFTETNLNGSGHATVLPYNPPGETEYRSNALRATWGGFYAPANVLYEKVQVARNFNKNAGTAPYGYTVYSFVTSKEYPNSGRYGDFDMSCWRGMVDTISVYSSNKRRVSKTVFEYDRKYIDSKPCVADMFQNVMGYARLSKRTETIDGVTKETRNKYATDIGFANDIVTTPTKETSAILPILCESDANHLDEDEIIVPISTKKIGGLQDLVLVGAWHEPDVYPNPIPNRYWHLNIMVVDNVDWPSCKARTPYAAEIDYSAIPEEQPKNLTVVVGNLEDNNTIPDICVSWAGTGTWIYLQNVQISGGRLVYTKIPWNDMNFTPETGAPVEDLQVINCAVGGIFGGMCEYNFIKRMNYCSYDYNGRPNEIWQTAPGSKQLVTKAIPAFCKYDAMKTAHLLTQSCQTTVYEKTSQTALLPSEVRAAQAMTYSNLLGCNTWLPFQSYSWKANIQTDGTPDKTFADFDHTVGAPNANWQLTGGVEKYDAFSAPLETKNAKGISSTTVYRNDVHLPIASIANANFKECGVFTGDYQSGENAAYWDYSNGWMKGTAEQGGSVSLVSDAHFGEKVIKVRNNYAAGRNNVIIPGKSYRMTAWVKVETGKMLMAVGFHYVQNT